MSFSGPIETIVGTPRARYLSGALAPISLLEGAESSTASSPRQPTSLDEVRNDETLAVADLSDAHEVQGVPVDEDESVGEASSAVAGDSYADSAHVLLSNYRSSGPLH